MWCISSQTPLFGRNIKIYDLLIIAKHLFRNIGGNKPKLKNNEKNNILTLYPPLKFPLIISKLYANFLML